MAELNFNALARPGPRGFMQGFEQGQEEQRVNAMAQQKMAQEQEMNALRMQQVRGTIGQQEREVKSQAAAQKTAMFRDRLLRARNLTSAPLFLNLPRWNKRWLKCPTILPSFKLISKKKQWVWPNG